MNSEKLLEPGTLLAEKFRIVRLLGQGAMGTAYEVEHERLARRFALKVLRGNDRADPEGLPRFRREIRAVGKIRHPHVVDVYDDGVLDSGQPFVVMELLEGETLAELIARKGPLEIDEMCECLAQACEGVQAAHDAGIVHRDLKPANVFVAERLGKPCLKILDFGVAKFVHGAGDDLAQTREGTMVGTPFYMAPEQIRGRTDVDARADVYALGVILYECATGHVPYRAETLSSLCVGIHEGNPEPLGRQRPDLPEAFGACVAQAMAVRRDERYGSARELGDVLRGMIGRMPNERPLVAIRDDARGKTQRVARRQDRSPKGQETNVSGISRSRFGAVMLVVGASIPTAMAFVGGMLVAPREPRTDQVQEVLPSATTMASVLESAAPVRVDAGADAAADGSADADGSHTARIRKQIASTEDRAGDAGWYEQ